MRGRWARRSGRAGLGCSNAAGAARSGRLVQQRCQQACGPAAGLRPSKGSLPRRAAAGAAAGSTAAGGAAGGSEASPPHPDEAGAAGTQQAGEGGAAGAPGPAPEQAQAQAQQPGGSAGAEVPEASASTADSIYNDLLERRKLEDAGGGLGQSGRTCQTQAAELGAHTPRAPLTCPRPAAPITTARHATPAGYPLMLDAMWCANVLDIQSTLQKVAKSVLTEAGQPKATLKARAAALKELAGIFQQAVAAQEPKQVGRRRGGAGWRWLGPRGASPAAMPALELPLEQPGGHHRCTGLYVAVQAAGTCTTAAAAPSPTHHTHPPHPPTTPTHPPTHPPTRPPARPPTLLPPGHC